MRAQAICIAASTALLASTVHAHAPLVRDLALTRDGGGVAARMPGFGWIVRRAEGEPFAYLCDALLDVDPSEAQTPFAYRADGSLLVGTAAGLRRVAPDGCPASPDATDLAGRAIVALATHPDDPDLVYAVAESDAALYRSEDGGMHWELRSRLGGDDAVTALVPVTGDRSVLYVSRANASGAATLWRSLDAGLSFDRFAQDGATVLLDVEPGPGGRLWARAQVETAPRVALVHADVPSGPWQEALRVHFFGGFAVAGDGDASVVWAGDEGGGVFRSPDGRSAFDEVRPETAVACLHEGLDAVWACTPGTPEQPAVVRLQGSDAVLEPIAVLAEVDRLVECDAALAVEDVCAAAWREWEVDVLGFAGSTDSASPSPADGAPTDAGEIGAPAPDAGRSSPARESGSGCAIVSPGAFGCTGLVAWAIFVACGIAVGRARVGGPVDARFSAEATEARSGEASDAALVERAQRGDVDAFAGIYDRHAPAVLALLARMLGSDAEARDLAHDVFLEAWRSVRAYDPRRASVRTWLFVRARSRALDRIGRRTRERAARRVLDASRASDAAVRFMPLERQLAVRRALDALDPSVRSALELTYYEGLTAAEIGERIGVPVGTVKSRLARGLAALAGALEDSGGTTHGPG